MEEKLSNLLRMDAKTGDTMMNHMRVTLPRQKARNSSREKSKNYGSESSHKHTYSNNYQLVG